MWLALTASSTGLLTGCQQTRTVLIASDREVIKLDAGKPFTAVHPGYFVPDARMFDILNALEKK